MKVAARFPVHACRNADFVTGRSQPGRVVDLQVDIETLPAIGMLCIHEDTVKQMVHKLGWKIEQEDALATAMFEVDGLKEQLKAVQQIVGQMQMAGFSEPETIEA